MAEIKDVENGEVENNEHLKNGNEIRIKETIWTEDEIGPVTEPIHPNFSRPSRYENVEFEKMYGKKFAGRVTKKRKDYLDQA